MLSPGRVAPAWVGRPPSVRTYVAVRLERVTALVPLLLTGVRSTPSARADRQEPLPMVGPRCRALLP